MGWKEIFSVAKKFFSDGKKEKKKFFFAKTNAKITSADSLARIFI